MRVTSGSWDHDKVLFREEVLEVRCVDGRLHVSRKVRKPDEWDRPVEAYSIAGRSGVHALTLVPSINTIYAYQHDLCKTSTVRCDSDLKRARRAR